MRIKITFIASFVLPFNIYIFYSYKDTLESSICGFELCSLRILFCILILNKPL